MKKLIPALCMLLVAAALLGTSTFAWFSMNTQVDAKGMQVKATTSSNLVIKAADGAWTREASAKYSSLNTLTPASTSLTDGVLSAGKFFYLTNPAKVDYATGAAQSGAEFAEATVNKDAQNTYVSANTFEIKVEGGTQAFTNLYISAVTVKDSSAQTAADADISKALRVAVVTTNKTYIFAPVTGYTEHYKGIIGAGTGLSEGTTLSTTDETLTNAGESATLGAIAAGETIALTVYIWYEGQDGNCTSGKAVNVEELDVALTFIAK